MWSAFKTLNFVWIYHSGYNIDAQCHDILLQDDNDHVLNLLRLRFGYFETIEGILGNRIKSVKKNRNWESWEGKWEYLPFVRLSRGEKSFPNKWSGNRGNAAEIPNRIVSSHYHIHNLLARTCACSILPYVVLDTSVRLRYRWNEVPDNVSLRKQAAMLDIKPHLQSCVRISQRRKDITFLLPPWIYIHTKTTNEYQRNFILRKWDSRKWKSKRTKVENSLIADFNTWLFPVPHGSFPGEKSFSLILDVLKCDANQIFARVLCGRECERGKVILVEIKWVCHKVSSPSPNYWFWHLDPFWTYERESHSTTY